MKLAFAVLLLLPASALAVDTDEVTGLIKNSGWELIRAHCGGCHSHALVTQQRADRNTWLEIIRWMQTTQNLWQFEPETEAKILDYLAASYPPSLDRRREPIPPALMPKRADSVQ
ncbi:MAG: hypothetical protein P8K83_02770 [Woeseiaceae bacterium]|nr:hypothetical protein [Woeseiaceae bacterium]